MEIAILKNMLIQLMMFIKIYQVKNETKIKKKVLVSLWGIISRHWEKLYWATEKDISNWTAERNSTSSYFIF